MKPKAGTALFSTVDTTSVVVIRWEADDLDVTCGGSPMVRTPPQSAGGSPRSGGATALGKRYCTENGAVELLCTKPGDGVLAVDGTPLSIKAGSPLPASD